MSTLTFSSFLFMVNTNASAQLQPIQQQKQQQQYLNQFNNLYPQQISHGDNPKTEEQKLSKQMQQPSYHQILAGQLPMTEQQKQSLKNQLFGQQNQQQFNPIGNVQQKELLSQSHPKYDQMYRSSFQSSSTSPTPHTSGNDLGIQVGGIINLSNNEYIEYYTSLVISGNTIHVAWTSHDQSPYSFKVLYTRSLHGGASFEPVRTISNDAYYPSLAVDGNILHMVYSSPVPGIEKEIYYTEV